MATRKIKIIRKKLGREKIWGQAHDHIELDSRLKGKKELEIIIHEAMHILFPEKEEDDVVKSSIILTNTLWYESYRKTDNHDKDPLQDGSL